MAYEQFPDNAQLSKNYLGTLKAFLPQELQRSLEKNDLRVLRCGGLGSLANLCGQETIERALGSECGRMNFLIYVSILIWSCSPTAPEQSSALA